MTNRSIIHVDMDAFYASVEQRDHPELRGRPVMVGGGSSRGVVAAASYEARQYGVRSAMPGARARRLCPSGVFVSARFERYREVSREVFDLLGAFSERIEGLSLDEAFIDVSERVNVHGEPLPEIGSRLKRRIAEQTGLTASVGMAHNKLLAKIASDYDKPDGLVHIPPDQVQRFLDPLPIRRLWGIGPRTAAQLHDIGVFTVGQLRRTSLDVLSRLFGDHAVELIERATGIDEREVSSQRVRRSISQETTFREDRHDIEGLASVMADQADKVARRLADRGLYARTVTIKLRSSGFSTITRSQSMGGHTRSAERILSGARELLESWAGWRRQFAVRLIGVGVSGLSERPDESDLLE
ncbi:MULTISPECIES: DNA polymerase IV [unclassified Wenzhouxiangella]|uniref:DNA polymerase IV n=1 Tax=unclassified Wenzhouxiangella TaxID=2613841 RepID=UPI000E327484|nr:MULTISPECIES: DNA polymerase IV [unclassified Wenzhouxiangella]RFF27941.1 DNA polymerase IV [Wenzhouxiangella sp. 15181]RFP68528.1 DNA polymerase IV [Wenzhouxiangella sp. 15190]